MRPPRTLLAAMRRGLVRALVATAVVGVGAIVTNMTPATLDVVPMPSREATLAEGHWCWTGGEHPLPGHVIVTLPSGKTVYGGRRLTGMALDQLFAGKDSGLTIHRFCR